MQRKHTIKRISKHRGSCCYVLNSDVPMPEGGAEKAVALNKSPEATNTMLFPSDESPLVLYRHSSSSVKSQVMATSRSIKTNKHPYESDAYPYNMNGYSSGSNKMPPDSNDRLFLSDKYSLNAAVFSDNERGHSMKANKHWLQANGLLQKTSNMLFVAYGHSLQTTIICGVSNSSFLMRDRLRTYYCGRPVRSLPWLVPCREMVVSPGSLRLNIGERWEPP